LSGALFVSTLYLQGVLRCSPRQAGLRTLPLPAGLALGGAAVPAVMARRGPRPPVTLGLGILTLAFAHLAATEPASRETAERLSGWAGPRRTEHARRPLGCRPVIATVRGRE
jgi:hypothetical protein